MHFNCYIIYSKSIDRYYVGSTTDLEERLKLHNNGFFGGKSYTFRASDWNIYLTIECRSLEHAVSIEKKIKRMKSRRYIENLSKYPELISKLLSDNEE